MEYGVKNSIKTVANLMEVLEGQLALIQLAVGKDFTDNLLSQSLDSGRSRIGKGTRSSFDGISQHNDSRLLGLRFRSRVAVIFFIDFLNARILLLLGFLVEVASETSSMVLLDDIDNSLSQMFLLSHGNTIFDMGEQYQATHTGSQLVVGILCALLVFDEIHGLLDFANVVIVCCHFGE